MKERTLLFGEAKSLVGVITEPAAAASAQLPAVLILNAGVLHRVGPNRLHVRLARELARHGLVSMRFDFSGLGDSRPRTDPTSFAQATVAETRQGMDVLSSRGARSFLLLGICSGADSALRAAGHDARVVGAALIEPYSVPAPGFLLYSYRHKVLNLLSWWRLLRGRSEFLAILREGRERAAGPEEPALPTMESIVPSRENLVRQVRMLLERGVDLCFVYSAGSPAYFNYLSLLRREVRRAVSAGGARLCVLKRTDHVFTPLAVQETLVAALRDWALAVAGRVGSGHGDR